MGALDNLFGLRRLLVGGTPVLDAAGRELFAQTFNLLGGWTVAAGVDAAGKATLELTPPAGGAGGSADWKDSVRVATTAALAASTRVGAVRTANANGALPSIDGVALAVNDDLLDKDHATQPDRGIWRVTALGSGAAPWVLTRRSDFDASAEVTGGLRIPVIAGTANGGKVWKLDTVDPIVLNTTSLAFSVDSGAVAPGGAPVNVTKAAAAAGAAASYSRSDHKHDVTTAAPDVVNLSGLTASEGSSTSLARADHTHSLTGRVPFANFVAASAADKVVGSDAAGNFKELGLSGGVERSGTSIQLSSQLPARGTENVIVDLYPSTQAQGTVATAASVTSDVAISTGKRYSIVADVWVDDGAGGSVLYTKTLRIKAHQTGGAAVIATNDTVDDNGGSGFTWLATISTTNVRFTLANTSGSTRSYNILIGFISADKP